MFNFQTLKGIVETAQTRFHNNVHRGENIVDINTFLYRARRGSKRFRKILYPIELDHIPHNIVKFCDNVDIVLGCVDSKKVNSFWNSSYLSNSTRTFLFKLYNNTLGYNISVAHFVRNHSRNCTFCDISGNQEIIDETPIHLFFQCIVVENILNEIFRWMLDDRDFELSRKECFAFFDRELYSPEKNFVLTFVTKVVLKFIWDSKQRFCLPNTSHCKLTIISELKGAAATNKNFRTMYENSGFMELVV
jgi:hypothetical protein